MNVFARCVKEVRPLLIPLSLIGALAGCGGSSPPDDAGASPSTQSDTPVSQRRASLSSKDSGTPLLNTSLLNTLSSGVRQIVVEYDPSGPLQDGAAMAQYFQALSGVIMTYERQLAVPDYHVLQLGSVLNADQLKSLKAALARDPSVLSVAEDRRFSLRETPSDSRFGEQWNLFETIGGINAPAAWNQATGRGVTVAVLDTGITSHSELSSKVLPGWDFISDPLLAADGNGRDSNPADRGDHVQANECEPGVPTAFRPSSWHGTHVAGVIAAVTNNGKGIAGVAPNAKLLPVRVTGKCGARESDVVDAIVWAAGGTVPNTPANANPAKVVNLSLGGPGVCSGFLQKSIDIARQKGATVVTAAGNDNIDAREFDSPSGCAGVINVAANNRAGKRATYSNFGRTVDISAPGGQRTVVADGILSTNNSGTTGPGSETLKFDIGTSFSAPHISGVVALLYELQPGISPNDVEVMIKAGARPMPGGCLEGCGAGIVDANGAIIALDTTFIATGGHYEQGLASSTGMIFRTVVVPPGARTFTVRISGGKGDADLLVRFGERPTDDDVADCLAGVEGNLESCTFNSPLPGIWHIGIDPFAAFSGVTLTAEWETF